MKRGVALNVTCTEVGKYIIVCPRGPLAPVTRKALVICMHYVYLLKSEKDASLYIGSTSDLKRRFAEHNEGKSRATKPRTPFQLVYYEAYKSRTDALFREKNLKRFSRAYQQLKQRIVNSI